MHHPTDGSAPGAAWYEARIPAVLVAVVVTMLLVAGWKVFRHLVG